MSRRSRILVLVAVAAAAAAVLTTGATLIFGDGERGRRGQPGAPPLALDLGVRTDPEARALRRAERLYAADRLGDARQIFARYSSPQARVGEALAAWPRGSLVRLEGLANERPRDSFVLLHLGFARFWAGDERGAVAAWRDALQAHPDSQSAGQAEDLLYPNYPRGRPVFVPGFAAAAELSGLPPARQLAALRRGAAAGDHRAKLQYGAALQRLGHPLSARRQYDAARALAPNDPETHVAAAVVRFDKARPSAAFSRLGPLARRFPRAQTVRFHLGLLLLWLARARPGSVEEGKAQLRRARALGPRTTLGREAARLLARLEDVPAR